MSGVCSNSGINCACLPGQDPYIAMVYPTQNALLGRCFPMDLFICNFDLTQCGNYIGVFVDGQDTRAKIYDACDPIRFSIFTSGVHTLSVQLYDALDNPIGTGDSGAFTSVGDLDIFMRALKSGKLLSEEMTREIMKPQSNIERKYDEGKDVYGYGFKFTYDKDGRLKCMSKDGENSGVAAKVAYYPDMDTTSIVLGNQTCNVWELHGKVEEEILKLSQREG